jgi:hypothetical protein
MKTKFGLLFMGLGLVFTLSCSKYPPESDRLLEDLAVFTQYDTKIDFNTFKTYSIPTSIKKITDKDTTDLTDDLSKAVLAEIDKNMQARGFTKSATAVKTDLAIQVLYYQNTQVYTYYYDYWGYGWYYPYYPYYPTYYASYTTGLCAIQLFDLKNLDENNRTPIRWNAFIRGILNEGHTTAEITGRVDQAFIQTPQLITTAK